MASSQRTASRCDMGEVKNDVPVNRIRALLRLSKDPTNAYEAANARLRANELMRRYDVVEGDLVETATETALLPPGRDGNQRVELARVIARSRGCTSAETSFTGYPEAAKDACQLFTALARIVEASCELPPEMEFYMDPYTGSYTIRQSGNNRLLWRICFWLGFVTAVQQQLDPEHGAIPKEAMASIVQKSFVPPDIAKAAEGLDAERDYNFRQPAYANGLELGNRLPGLAYKEKRP